MTTQALIIIFVFGLVVLVPLWTIASVRLRYGTEAFSRPWWWLWSRIGCNGIMGAGVALSVFGVWAWTQDIKDPSWGGVFLWILIAALLCVGGAILLLRKKPTETLYQESFLLTGVWFAAMTTTVVMYLVNGLSVHVLNGLLLTVFGAVFTRFLKQWI